MADLLTNINQAISDFNSIKTAIINKGVEVPSNIPTSSYSNLIESIVAGTHTSIEDIAIEKLLTEDGIKYCFNNGISFVTSAVDLNTFETSGVYIFKPENDSVSFTHFPTGMGGNGVLLVHQTIFPSTCLQIYYDNTTCAFRVKWDSWKNHWAYFKNSQLPEIVMYAMKYTFTNKGTQCITDITDFNTIIEFGNIKFNPPSIGIGNSMINFPTQLHKWGVFIIKNFNNIIIQLYYPDIRTSNNSYYNQMAWRIFRDGVWTNWEYLQGLISLT